MKRLWLGDIMKALSAATVLFAMMVISTCGMIGDGDAHAQADHLTIKLDTETLKSELRVLQGALFDLGSFEDRGHLKLDATNNKYYILRDVNADDTADNRHYVYNLGKDANRAATYSLKASSLSSMVHDNLSLGLYGKDDVALLKDADGVYYTELDENNEWVRRDVMPIADKLNMIDRNIIESDELTILEGDKTRDFITSSLEGHTLDQTETKDLVTAEHETTRMKAVEQFDALTMQIDESTAPITEHVTTEAVATRDLVSSLTDRFDSLDSALAALANTDPVTEPATEPTPIPVEEATTADAAGTRQHVTNEATATRSHVDTVVTTEAGKTREHVTTAHTGTRQVVSDEAKATRQVVSDEAIATRTKVSDEAGTTRQFVSDEAIATRSAVVDEAVGVRDHMTALVTRQEEVEGEDGELTMVTVNRFDDVDAALSEAVGARQQLSQNQVTLAAGQKTIAAAIVAESAKADAHRMAEQRRWKNQDIDGAIGVAMDQLRHDPTRMASMSVGVGSTRDGDVAGALGFHWKLHDNITAQVAGGVGAQGRSKLGAGMTVGF